MIASALKRFPEIEQLARKLVSLYPLSSRLGPDFWKWYAFFQESETWLPEKLVDFQMDQVRRLLSRLAETSPFYKERLSSVDPSAISGVEEFRKLVPTLTRSEYAANYSTILNRSFDRHACQVASTSGTTGNALEFFHRAEDAKREWAAICYQWKRAGYDPGHSRRAEFRGLTPRGHLSQSYPDKNMVRFSILDIRQDTLPQIASIIEKQHLEFYHGYPSVLYLLAREVVKSGMRFPQPTGILLASEMVYDFQTEQIQAAFPQARLFAHYGCAERTVLAGWCEHRRVYHVLPQYSLTELSNEKGEIIGTNLFNDVNGFVRYRMTDAASEVETAPCPACKRPYSLLFGRVEGRQEDYLFSKQVGWISPAIVTYPLKHLHSIQELQFLQSDPEEIVVNYIARNGATKPALEAEVAEIETGVRRIVGQEIRLAFKQVDGIARGKTGKYKWIISKLDPPR